MAGVDVGTAYLTVVPSAKGFAGKLQTQLGGGMASAGSKAGSTASKAFGSSFGAGISSAGKAGALAIGGALALGIGFAKGAIAEARESQKVGATTNAIIKATGGAAKISADGVGDLSTALSNKTGVDDEVIQSGANMLLTFKNVRNEAGKGAQIFDRATAAATDLAAAGFGDVKSASVLMGKALNDPIKGITALGRSGVTFTQQQKDQIKTLVDSGKTLDAQKLILKEVEGQVGGTAAASATAGEKMSTAFGNFKEGIGTSMLPVLDKVEGFVSDNLLPGIQGVIDILFKGDFTKGFAKAFNISEDSPIVNFLFNVREGMQKVGDFIKTTIIPAIKNFFREFQAGEGAGGRFRAILETIVAVAQRVATWIGNNAGLVRDLAGALLIGVGVFKTLTTAVRIYTAVQTALNFVMTANPIGIIIVAIALLVAGIVLAYQRSETFRNIVKGAFEAVGAAARFMWNNVIAPVIRFLLLGFDKVTGYYSTLLRALSHIPGFGWAAKAADALDKAGDKARDMAAGIKDIPDHKDVAINLRVTGAGQVVLKNGVKVDVGQYRARATGGPVWPGGAFAVGDNPDGSWNSTTELFVPKTAGTIYNQSQMAGMGGGRMHPHDIAAIVNGFAQSQPVAVMSAGSADRALGRTLR